jgi:hypothetical protein
MDWKGILLVILLVIILFMLFTPKQMTSIQFIPHNRPTPQPAPPVYR